jgi:sirohydrochlorin cobaltochelatase
MDDAAAIVVVVAHGSRAQPANDAHRAFCEALADRLGVDVRPAFLELAEPSIPEALDTAAADTSRIVLHPHFLAPGNHTTRDIPAIVGDAATRHPAVRIEVTDHTGADPALAQLVATALAARL